MTEMKRYTVKFTAEFLASIEVPRGESLRDAVCEIDIPESATVTYVADSFDVQEIVDSRGRRVELDQTQARDHDPEIGR